MSNFLIGFLAGIGNIVPGLSGSALLIGFGLYEPILKAISNIFKDFKNSILFLFPIGVGILIGSFLFSNVITFFINKSLVVTMLLFTGLLLGTIPSILKEASINGYKNSYLIAFIITFVIGIILLFFKQDNYYNSFDYNFFKLIITGLILASSTIIPGISSTVLLTIFGMYQIYINAINSLNILILFPILIGLGIGVFLLSKLINFLLKKYYGYTYFAILGFTIATIPGLLLIPFSFDINLLIGIILGFISFIFCNYSLKNSN